MWTPRAVARLEAMLRAHGSHASAQDDWVALLVLSACPVSGGDLSFSVLFEMP